MSALAPGTAEAVYDHLMGRAPMTMRTPYLALYDANGEEVLPDARPIVRMTLAAEGTNAERVTVAPLTGRGIVVAAALVDADGSLITARALLREPVPWSDGGGIVFLAGDLDFSVG